MLINAVFGLNFATTGRTDLAAVYIPDVLRVDTTTGPVPLIGQGGNRLSGLGGDTDERQVERMAQRTAARATMSSISR